MTVLQSGDIADNVRYKIRDTLPVLSDVLVHAEPLGSTA
jgi:divalent metal cation (Fe/Co/Zn/Cd) transporter